MKDVTFDEFLAGSGGREGEFALLDRIVREMAPDLDREVLETSVGYGPFTDLKGRPSHRVRLAPRRGGVTVHLSEGARVTVAGASPGVGCLKIRDLARVDLDALRREIARSVSGGNGEEMG